MALRETYSGRLRCPTTMRWTVGLLFEWGNNGKGFYTGGWRADALGTGVQLHVG